MDRRREPRVSREVCVQISGLDLTGARFTQTVVARSLSFSGGLLTGVQHGLRSGDYIALRRERQLACFRVIWVRGDRAAIQKLKDQPCLWPELLEEQVLGSRR